MSRGLRDALALAFAASLVVACMPATVASAPGAQASGSTMVPLRNPGYEDAPRSGERCAPHWGCTMHADPDAFAFRLDATTPAAGQRSLCIERVKPEPWGIATQAVDIATLRGQRLRFSLAVRAERLDGRGAGAWIQVHGVPAAQGHVERLVTATDGWQRIAVEFTVAPAATLLEVGAVLEGGGRACIDEARLEVLGPR